MNKARRKTLDRLLSEIESIRDKLEDIKSEVETVRDEEQDSYDNIPESMQNGEKGENMQSAINALETALEYFGDLDEAMSSIQEAMDY